MCGQKHRRTHYLINDNGDNENDSTLESQMVAVKGNPENKEEEG